MYDRFVIPTILSSESIKQKVPQNETDVDIYPEFDIFPELTSDTDSTYLPQSDADAISEACRSAETELRSQFLRIFEQLIHECEFEFGFISSADNFVRDAFNTYGSFAREWINDLFLRRFDDPFILSAILRVIAHFDYRQMYPQGITMAVAATVHIDAEVRECGIRCFESWEAPECLSILKNLYFQEDWLNDYLADVIRELEQKRKKNGSIC